MDIEERVVVKNSMGKSDLGSIVFSACRGEYVSIFKRDDKEAISKLDSVIRAAFDDFAQKCFDAGRDYQKAKASTQGAV